MKVIVLPLFIVFANVTSILADCNELNVYNVTDLDTLKINLAITKLNDFKILGGKEKFEVPIDKEDALITTDELVERLGFNIAEYTVMLPGGFGFNLYRINNRRPGPAVFLMHGLFGSHDDWILAGKNGLAIFLAEAGFDVWMGNARGNKYFRERYHFDLNCKEFWHFTWDEMGKFDLSAAIDYVLQTTRRKTMIFIGYSQGSTSALVLLSNYKQFNSKISLFIAIAPLAFLTNARSPLLKMFSLWKNETYMLRKAIGLQEFVPSKVLTTTLSKVLCDKGTITQYVCKNFMFQLCGFNVSNLDIPNLPLILKRYPSRGSSKTLLHYAQLLASGQFRRYDFNQSENINVYGSVDPPDYNLENITTPTILFYSNDDWMSNNTDVESMIAKLPNVISSHVIDGYSHLDFIFAYDVKSKVYIKVLDAINKNKEYWSSV